LLILDALLYFQLGFGFQANPCLRLIVKRPIETAIVQVNSHRQNTPFSEHTFALQSRQSRMHGFMVSSARKVGFCAGF
jgi:hypothetical protein